MPLSAPNLPEVCFARWGKIGSRGDGRRGRRRGKKREGRSRRGRRRRDGSRSRTSEVGRWNGLDRNEVCGRCGGRAWIGVDGDKFQVKMLRKKERKNKK